MPNSGNNWEHLPPIEIRRVIADLETRKRLGYKEYEPLRGISFAEYEANRVMWEAHLENLLGAAYYYWRTANANSDPSLNN